VTTELEDGEETLLIEYERIIVSSLKSDGKFMAILQTKDYLRILIPHIFIQSVYNIEANQTKYPESHLNGTCQFLEDTLYVRGYSIVDEIDYYIHSAHLRCTVEY